MVVAGVGIFVILILYAFSIQTDKKPDKKIEDNAVTTKPMSPFEMEKRDVTGRLPGQKVMEDIGRPVIQFIKLIPEQPTIFDNIKAEVKSDYKGEGKITYKYQWKINGKAADDVKGDTLPARLFKKKDQVSVLITPYADDTEGYPYESMFIVIHSAPPSLKLREMSQKLNNTIEFQLISIDPDNDKVTFSLEAPILEGMTINKETGKITWKIEKKEKKTYKFSASATDVEGVKTTKTFEFTIHNK